MAFERQAMQAVRLFDPQPGCAASFSFQHIFSGGYAAGYYSYKWAEVLEADVFALFRERGVFDADTAGQLRRHILERGGGEHPMELFKAFRGQEERFLTHGSAGWDGVSVLTSGVSGVRRSLDMMDDI
jgi:peptidyl-dipeptidase Dcp